MGVLKEPPGTGYGKFLGVLGKGLKGAKAGFKGV